MSLLNYIENRVESRILVLIETQLSTQQAVKNTKPKLTAGA